MLKSIKTVIFVNGCYWHGHDCPRGWSKPKTNSEFWANKISQNQVRDASSISSIKEGGWRVVVLWECHLKDVQALRVLLAEELIV